MKAFYPYWLTVAYDMIGIKEIKGPKHNSTIVGWLDALGAWWKNDEEPWCGVFMAHIMQTCHYTYPAMYMRAKAWLSWGQRLTNPVLGCVVILDRKGGGHVAFVVGVTPDNSQLAILGGNQGNQVSVMMVDISRVLGYRLPPGYSYARTRSLPVAQASDFLKSSNEA